VILSSTNPGDIILDPFFGTGTTGAVAKRLGRHWIGIEAEAGYVSIAQERIEAVVPHKSSETFAITRDRHANRIPFVSLINAYLLKPGQTLYFGPHGDRQAIILANGHIRCDEYSGSIHQVGRQILKAPCNGWMAWYYIDEKTGEREPINNLRQKMHDEMERIRNKDDDLAGD
jgi:modification methylase